MTWSDGHIKFELGGKESLAAMEHSTRLRQLFLISFKHFSSFHSSLQLFTAPTLSSHLFVSILIREFNGEVTVC